MHFRLYAIRLNFIARGAILFSRGAAGNGLRGAFGSILQRLACVTDCPGPHDCQAPDSCEYALMFAPTAAAGPSGLADQPRPYVFRANHLNGRTIAPGEPFHFDFHWFDLRRPSVKLALRAFRELAHEGLGPDRHAADLVEVVGDDAALRVSLDPPENPVQRVKIRFETPTELKAEGQSIAQPEFGVLASRIRDRISTLRALYDEGPLKLDFREFSERAARVRMTRCDIRHLDVSRRSSATGQIHPLGGFVGEAEYEGDLTEFIPYLHAARWTGVGRQTAWGKGVLRVTEELEGTPRIRAVGVH
ncbi:MAG TPA: CRISPR system precrRNA processing endoribonuclease RAMP protein Cas6 [Bryobacteraceae bacterium]